MFTVKNENEWKGGVIIRYLRSRKFRKKQKGLFFGIQALLIWYAAVISSISLVGYTGAAFNDIESLDSSLHVKWDVPDLDLPDNDEWDKSSLDFDGSQAGGSCSRIYTTIFNAGDKANATSTWRFYVYNVSDMNTPIDTGIVPVIESMSWGEISSDQVSENGTYKFTIRRPLGHPAKNKPDENGYTYIGWSEEIIVDDCNPDSVDDGNSGDDGTADGEENAEDSESGNDKENDEDSESGNDKENEEDSESRNDKENDEDKESGNDKENDEDSESRNDKENDEDKESGNDKENDEDKESGNEKENEEDSNSGNDKENEEGSESGNDKDDEGDNNNDDERGPSHGKPGPPPGKGPDR